MTLYRKKPIEVHAEKWDPNHPEPVFRMVMDHAITAAGEIDPGSRALIVTTVDGNRVKVPVGAYVVIDGKGFPYPCDVELFLAGHDIIEDPAQQQGTAAEWEQALAEGRTWPPYEPGVPGPGEGGK